MLTEREKALIERYHNDPHFHALVARLRRWLEAPAEMGGVLVSELRDGLELAEAIGKSERATQAGDGEGPRPTFADVLKLGEQGINMRGIRESLGSPRGPTGVAPEEDDVAPSGAEQ